MKSKFNILFEEVMQQFKTDIDLDKKLDQLFNGLDNLSQQQQIKKTVQYNNLILHFIQNTYYCYVYIEDPQRVDQPIVWKNKVNTKYGYTWLKNSLKQEVIKYLHMKQYTTSLKSLTSKFVLIRKSNGVTNIVTQPIKNSYMSTVKLVTKNLLNQPNKKVFFYYYNGPSPAEVFPIVGVQKKFNNLILIKTARKFDVDLEPFSSHPEVNAAKEILTHLNETLTTNELLQKLQQFNQTDQIQIEFQNNSKKYYSDISEFRGNIFTEL